MTEGRNGFLIEETSEALAACLLSLDQEKMRDIGLAASRELYISWEEAVNNAARHYPIVIDRYKSGYYPPKKRPIEGLMKINGELMEALSRLPQLRQKQEV